MTLWGHSVIFGLPARGLTPLIPTTQNTYPGQCVLALDGVVQPNDPHILFSCDVEKEQ